jgi:hypothetical protein
VTTPAPTPGQKKTVSIKDFLLSKRRVKELPAGTAVEPGTGCTESGCSSVAVIACQHPLMGKKAGSMCGRRLCIEHSGVNDVTRKKGAPVLCGPHGRHPSAPRLGR